METDTEIFCSYAHEDYALWKELEKHLSTLKGQGLIASWYCRNINAGTEWAYEIDMHLNTAQIILLLVSAHFIASDYCYSVEMKRALERHEAGEARLIPIILRPALWEYAPFGKLQALPKNDKPVTNWRNHHDAYIDIARGIRKAIEELGTKPLASSLGTRQAQSTPENIFQQKRSSTIEFSIEQGDITSFDADVVAFKHAQGFYGADRMVASALNEVGVATERLRPLVGDYRYIETRGSIKARNALFVGVPVLIHFGYQEIREFSANVLNILANIAPDTRYLAMTIHGVTYGLDEVEAVRAQFAGYLEAIQSGRLPPELAAISIVESDSFRVQRLRLALEEILDHADYATRVTTQWKWAYHLAIRPSQSIFNRFSSNAIAIGAGTRGGIESTEKPHVFVAMPFKDELVDVFHYGIENPVHEAGFLCERVDQDIFTGDILDRIKKRIETAAIVIAELTGSNPNVYLEVGYAWGKGRPTILLVKDSQELRFDIQSQRCLTYKSITHLEESLTKELKGLRSKGLI